MTLSSDLETEKPLDQIERETSDRSSYRQILKSSALIGGSQALTIAIGIIRTKAMALLLGPSGVGLFGLYGSICDLTQSIAGLGVNSSGVRQIAKAVSSGDGKRAAETAVALRNASFLLALIGAALLIVLSRPISVLTFGSTENSASIALLSAAVAIRLISAGQGALIQGTRRLTDLAKMSVLGALGGLLAGVPIVYLLREKGIVPCLIVVAVATITTSWWYSRKIEIKTPPIALRTWITELPPMLMLGLAFMVTALMSIGSAYIIRVFILHKLGVEATGLYQSAWTLGGLYVSFILQAMGADFYPRLTQISDDDAQCNRLVNEQAHIGLLIAGPGALATLTLAPIIISVFYTPRFGPAVPILRWISLGTALQVITWPMGFISLAKGRSRVFFCSDFAWTTVYLVLVFSCVNLFGLRGVGIAFFAAYVFHLGITYPIARQLSGFRWSRENKTAGICLLGLVSIVFLSLHVLPFYAGAALGVTATIGAAVYSARTLLLLSTVTAPSLPFALQRFLPSKMLG